MIVVESYLIQNQHHQYLRVEKAMPFLLWMSTGIYLLQKAKRLVNFIILVFYPASQFLRQVKFR